MAITGAQLQAALGATSGRDPKVVREFGVVSTYQEWLIVPFDCWRALEHLEGCLERLTDQKQEVGP